MTSIEKRTKIVQAREKGMRVEEIVRVYNVGRSTVYDLCRLAHETGTIHPRPHAYGRKPALNEEKLQALRQLLAESGDITLQDIIDRMELNISVSALSRIIRNKLHYQYKKRQYMPPAEGGRTFAKKGNA